MPGTTPTKVASVMAQSIYDDEMTLYDDTLIAEDQEQQQQQQQQQQARDDDLLEQLALEQVRRSNEQKKKREELRRQQQQQEEDMEILRQQEEADMARRKLSGEDEDDEEAHDEGDTLQFDDRLPPPLPSDSEDEEGRLGTQKLFGEQGKKGKTGALGEVDEEDEDDEDLDKLTDGTNAKGKKKGKADPTSPKKPRKPTAKLDTIRLMSDQGIPMLHTRFSNLKFKGRKHAIHDFRKLMRMYEGWAHTLFPKFPLRDFAFRVENVCHRKLMRLHLFRWLQDPTKITSLSKEIITPEDESQPQPGPSETSGPRNAPPAAHSSAAVPPKVAPIFAGIVPRPADQPKVPAATIVTPQPPAPSNAVSQLTPEQLELIARNKAHALAKLAERKRLLEIQRREEEMLAQDKPDEFESLPSSAQFESPEDVSQVSSSGSSQPPMPAVTAQEDESLRSELERERELEGLGAPPPPKTLDLPNTLMYD